VDNRNSFKVVTPGRGADVDSWPRGIGAITLFVEDLDAAKKFYRDVFGLPVAFENDDSAAFNFGNTIINLLKTRAARELVEPATVAGPEAGARLQFTIEVDDVDAMVRGAGHARSGATERPDGSALGSANRQLPRSWRPQLGDRPVVDDRVG
jgi:catechol 2,3-dioxygenase-like lactoylglutathione lyase family enzyme